MLFTHVLLHRSCSMITPLRFVPGIAPLRCHQASPSFKLDHTTNLILGRRYSTEPKFNNQRIASTFRRMDGIPSNYELIYRVTFPSYLIAIQAMNLVTIITITFVVVGLLLQYNVKENSPEESEPTKPKEFPPQLGAMKIFERDDKRLPTPYVDELIDLSWENTAVALLAFVGLSVALVRLQRTLPIRLYTSASRHSYAVFYGHIIPSRTTQREFVAGTLKSPKNGKSFLSHAVFEDAAGNQMVLLEHCFRFPSDFNFLLGFKKHLHDDDEDSNTGKR